FVGKIGKEKFYDERDQEGEKIGRYYNHSVVVTGLDPQKEYSFRIGGGIFLYGRSDSEVEFNATTTNVREELPVPDPLWGSVIENDGETSAEDAVVLLRLESEKGELSNYVSTVTSESGSWTLDANSFYSQDLSEPFSLKGDVEVIMWVRTEKGETYKREGILEQFAPTGPLELDNHLEKIQEKTAVSALDTLVGGVYAKPRTIDGAPCDERGCGGSNADCCDVIACGRECIEPNGGKAEIKEGYWQAWFNEAVWKCWEDKSGSVQDCVNGGEPPAGPGCEKHSIKVDIFAIYKDDSPAKYKIDKVGVYFGQNEKYVYDAYNKSKVSYTIEPSMIEWDNIVAKGGALGVSASTEGFDTVDGKGNKLINICEYSYVDLYLISKENPSPPPPPGGECASDCSKEPGFNQQSDDCSTFESDDKQYGPGGKCMSKSRYETEENPETLKTWQSSGWKTFSSLCPGSKACTGEGTNCEWMCRVPPRKPSGGERTLSISVNPKQMEVSQEGVLESDKSFSVDITYTNGKEGDSLICDLMVLNQSMDRFSQTVGSGFDDTVVLEAKKDDYNNYVRGSEIKEGNMYIGCSAGHLWDQGEYVNASVNIDVIREGQTPPQEGKNDLIIKGYGNPQSIKVANNGGVWTLQSHGNLYVNLKYSYKETEQTSIICELEGINEAGDIKSSLPGINSTNGKYVDLDDTLYFSLQKDHTLSVSASSQPTVDIKCQLEGTEALVNSKYTFEVVGAPPPEPPPPTPVVEQSVHIKDDYSYGPGSGSLKATCGTDPNKCQFDDGTQFQKIYLNVEVVTEGDGDTLSCKTENVLCGSDANNASPNSCGTASETLNTEGSQTKPMSFDLPDNKYIKKDESIKVVCTLTDNEDSKTIRDELYIPVSYSDDGGEVIAEDPIVKCYGGVTFNGQLNIPLKKPCPVNGTIQGQYLCMKKSECESDVGKTKCEQKAREALENELSKYLMTYDGTITCTADHSEVLPEGQICKERELTEQEKKEYTALYLCNCPPSTRDFLKGILGFECSSGYLNPLDTSYASLKNDGISLRDYLVEKVSAQEKEYYPLYNAKLTFTATDGEKFVTRSDEYGKFTFDLDKGKKYTVNVEHDEYKTLETDFMAVEDINYNLKLVLESGDSQQYGGFADITEVSGTQKLARGWNLITLNIAPDKEDYMASDLLSDINSQGLFVSRVMRYRDGVWQVHRQGTDDANDFRLKLGEGYILKSDSKGEFTIRGKGLKSSVPVQLTTGWNLVGIPYSESEYTAVGIIDSANTANANVDTVSKWESRWINVVKTEGLVYGHDFKIENNRAYFIRNMKAIYWEP
ncbi:MAG: hypothetical protein ABIE03_04315, partial [Patescibacteria group bacterium]